MKDTEIEKIREKYPVLSFRHGIIGLACCGLSRVEIEPTLFEDKDPLF